MTERARHRAALVPVQTFKGWASSRRSLRVSDDETEGYCDAAAGALAKIPVSPFLTQAAGRTAPARQALWPGQSPSGWYCTTKSQVIRPSFRCSLCGLDCLKQRRVSQRHSNFASWSVSYLDLSQNQSPAEGSETLLRAWSLGVIGNALAYWL